MTSRRTAIEHFCRMFLTGELQPYKNIYRDLVRPLVSDIHPSVDVSDFIERTGEELFNVRPADMAYIMVFLEFVSQVHETAKDISINICVASAANVIEKTTFNPVPDRRRLYRAIISIFVNICVSIINWLH